MVIADQAPEMDEKRYQSRTEPEFEALSEPEAPAMESSDADEVATADASRLSVRMSKTDIAINTAIERAEQLLKDGQAHQALKMLDQALLLEADNPFLKARLWRSKARVLDALGHETEAQQARKTAAKLDPAR